MYLTYHGHDVVDALDPLRVGEEVHDEVAQVGAVRLGHVLDRALAVLALDSSEAVASQG